MLLVEQPSKIVLGVDPASRYSAAVLWDGSQVVTQFDSVGLDASQWVWHLGGSADGAVVVVEDVPPKIQWAGTVKRVCRL